MIYDNPTAMLEGFRLSEVVIESYGTDLRNAVCAPSESLLSSSTRYRESF